MLVVASLAAAQEQPDPFRFLRPRLQAQDGGNEAPPSAAPAPGIEMNESSSTAAPDGGEAAAGSPPTDVPQSAGASPQTPSAPAPETGSGEPADIAGPASAETPQSAVASPQAPSAPAPETGTGEPANIAAPDGAEAVAGPPGTDAPQSAAASPETPTPATNQPNTPAPAEGEAVAAPERTDAPQSAAAAPAQPNPFLILRPWLEGRFGRRSETQSQAPSQVPSITSPGAEAVEPANVAAPDADDAAAGPPQTDAAEAAATEPPQSAAPDASEPSGITTTAPASPEPGSRVIGTLPPLQRERPGMRDLAAPQGREKLERREAPQPLRLAVLAGDDPTATIRSLAPVTDALSRAIARPVEILPVASYEGMIDAQVERRIDGGFYSAAAFAAAEGECRCLEPLVAPASSDGTTAYHAVIVARRDSGISSAADLAGRSIATGAADSIGARRMQLAGLLAEGIDPKDFGEVFTVGSAEDAVRLAAQDAVDAAFAWSSLAGDLSRGYSRGTLADLVARGEIGADELAIIWRSPPITHGPVAVLRSLPEPEKDALESYLLRLGRLAPEIYDRLNPLYSRGYVAVDASDYAGLAVLATQNVDAVKLPEAGVEGPPFPPEEATSP
jgi:phosphonate transport system substrate-binding protein